MLAAFLAHHRAARERLAGEAAALEEEIAGLEARLRAARGGRGEARGPERGARPLSRPQASLRLLRVPPLGFCYGAFHRRAEAPRQPFLGPAREQFSEIVVEEGQREALTRYFASLPLEWSECPPASPSERPQPAAFLFHYFFDRNSSWAGMTLPPKQTRRVGLFSCRTPHRPNALGQSIGVIVSCRATAGLCSSLLVQGLDTLNGTPILALTRYSPEMDCRAARGGWMDRDRLLSLYYDEVDAPNDVTFSPEAEKACSLIQELGIAPGLREAVLAKLERTHPLSRSHKAKSLAGAEKVFADAFGGFKVRYTCREGQEEERDSIPGGPGGSETAEAAEAAGASEGQEAPRAYKAYDAPPADRPGSPILSIRVLSITPTLSLENAEKGQEFDPEAAAMWRVYQLLDVAGASGPCGPCGRTGGASGGAGGTGNS